MSHAFCLADGTEPNANQQCFKVSNCGCSGSWCQCPQQAKISQKDVASTKSIEGLHTLLFPTDTKVAMLLPSSALLLLQLCQQLECLTVFGNQITDLTFVNNLPKLTELNICATQVHNLSLLTTLPCLRSLSITDMHLEGGNEVDLSVLVSVDMLEEVSFCGSSAVAGGSSDYPRPGQPIPVLYHKRQITRK